MKGKIKDKNDPKMRVYNLMLGEKEIDKIITRIDLIKNMADLFTAIGKQKEYNIEIVGIFWKTIECLEFTGEEKALFSSFIGVEI